MKHPTLALFHVIACACAIAFGCSSSGDEAAFGGQGGGAATGSVSTGDTGSLSGPSGPSTGASMGGLDITPKNVALTVDNGMIATQAFKVTSHGADVTAK